MSSIETMLEEVAKQPLLLRLVKHLLGAILKSRDPVQAVRRAAMAVAAREGAHKSADAALKAKAAAKAALRKRLK